VDNPYGEEDNWGIWDSRREYPIDVNPEYRVTTGKYLE
jgi:hypothetical protein